MVSGSRMTAVAYMACAWLGLYLSPGISQAQPPPNWRPFSLPAAPAVTPPRPHAKFASPREALRTFYFSILAYDFRPALIEDAVACLEPAPDKVRDFADAARLAVDLDTILRELCFPVNAVAEVPEGDTFVAYEADGFKIAFHRQADGSWRFK